MNKISVVLAGMFALAGSIALAAAPSAGSSGGSAGGGGSSGSSSSGSSSSGGGSSSSGGSGGGGGSRGGGGGGFHGGGGGGYSASHGGSGYGGGAGGSHGYDGGTHSAAAAAGWARSGGGNSARAFASGANGAPPRAVELRNHAAARAIEAATHGPHPPRPNGPPRHPVPHRPGGPVQQVTRDATSARCEGNLDCALWSRPDLYCMDNPADYYANAVESIRCPHPRRIEINQRTGQPTP